MEYHIILKRSMCPKMENSKMEYLIIPKRCITHEHWFFFLLFFNCRDYDWSDDESDSDFNNMHQHVEYSHSEIIIQCNFGSKHLINACLSSQICLQIQADSSTQNSIPQCVGVYIVMVCPWTDHILARNPLLEVEADLSWDPKRGNFPTDFHSYIWREMNSNKNTKQRVSTNWFGLVGPIDTSVSQRTNTSIGIGPSIFLQHALQIYTRASSL